MRGQIVGGPRQLVAGCGILLHDFLQLADAQVNLADGVHLLLGCLGNLLDQVGGIADLGHRPIEQCAGILGNGDAFLGKVADLLSGGLAPFREFSDLARDDREAFTMRPARAASIAAFSARRLV